jgi:transcriptional regulator with XRE-family HTH domain
MDRAQEEAVQRITAQYVEEVRSGHRPNISDYLARYPQYANQIVDFVSYFHAVEVDLPTETPPVPVLPHRFRIAIDSARELAIQPNARSMTRITTLLILASKRRLTQLQLADKIGVSEDIVTKLEQRKIKAVTIPLEIFKRLSEVLQQPLSVIQAYFGISRHSQIAEPQVAYQVNSQAQNFREALEESVQLPEEQKYLWRNLLDAEGL